MRARHILLFDGLGVSVHRWQSGQLRREQTFPLQNPDPVEILRFLGERRSDIFYILADVADEIFQLEVVPHVRRRDRCSLIDRKLAQHLRGTPLRTAISLGRSNEGRGDERLLLCALPAHAQFEPWLAALRQLKARLVGVFSLPMVIADTASRLFERIDRALIVCITHAGVRHTFLDQGRLRFSRQTPLGPGSAEELASALAAESRRTYDYLIGQRLVDHDTPLSILVLAHPDHFDAIRSQLPCSSTLSVRCVDLTSIGEACRLIVKLDGSHSEELWLNFLIRHPAGGQFASREDRRCYQLDKIGLGLRTAAAVTLLASLWFAGAYFWQAQQDSSRAETVAAETAINESQLQRLEAALPKDTIGAERLRALATRADIIVRRSNAPEHLLRQLADTLTQVPDIQLESLSWRVGSPSNVTTTDKMLPAGKRGRIVAEVQATLPPASAGDGRGPRSSVDHMFASLAAIDGMAAGSSDPHIAVDSTQALQGGTPSSTGDALRFSFWLALGL